MGKKSKKTRVEKTATGPMLRWLVCEEGDVHVFGPCPRCFSTSGGMLIGSTLAASRGIARAQCTDCGESIDYFVDPQQKQMWKAEPIREPAGTASGLH
ncbi:MAG: hypothetical protein QUS33_06860 [Dehalococcoidia bacterium]|nr:hypothetical protein [Dehalococcoidia bacterium]